jgi:hypothetical protein
LTSSLCVVLSRLHIKSLLANGTRKEPSGKSISVVLPSGAKIIARKVTVENLKTREISVDEADVVVSARGTLNDVSWPKVDGFSDLTIPTMHSAIWDDRLVSQHRFRSLNIEDVRRANTGVAATTSRTNVLASLVEAVARFRSFQNFKKGRAPT